MVYEKGHHINVSKVVLNEIICFINTTQFYHVSMLIKVEVPRI